MKDLSELSDIYKGDKGMKQELYGLGTRAYKLE